MCFPMMTEGACYRSRNCATAVSMIFRRFPSFTSHQSVLFAARIWDVWCSSVGRFFVQDLSLRWIRFPIDQDAGGGEGIRVPEQPLSLSLQGEGRHRAGRDHGASRSHPPPFTSRPSVPPTVHAASASRLSSSQWRYISSPPPIQGTVVCCDYQEIQVQERIQMLKVGTMPRSISVILLNDLVDMCKVCFFTLSHPGW